MEAGKTALLKLFITFFCLVPENINTHQIEG